jgi:hypothetical protein
MPDDDVDQQPEGDRPDAADAGERAAVGAHEGEKPEAKKHEAEETLPRRRSRRVTTPPPPGSDPTPLPEPPRGTGAENDERLKADKPPHY